MTQIGPDRIREKGETLSRVVASFNILEADLR